MEDLIPFTWNCQKTLMNALHEDRFKGQYADVTIACDGEYFKAHRIVLSSSSKYFEEILNSAQCEDPLIIIKDTRASLIKLILEYVYIGEVNINQQDISEFVYTANSFKIKGIPETVSKYENINNKKSISNLDITEKNSKNLSTSKENNSTKSVLTSNPIPMILCKNSIKTEPVSNDESEEDSMLAVVINESFENDKNTTSNKSIKTESNLDISDTFEDEMHTDETPENAKANNFSLTLVESNKDGAFSEGDAELEGPVPKKNKMDTEIKKRKPLIGKESDISGIILLQCNTCNFKSMSTSLIMDHQCDLEKKKYKCDKCDFYTASNSLLRNHRCDLDETRPYYQCDFCEYRSTQRYELRRHFMVHTGEKPYQCDYCDVRSAKQSNIKRHVRNIHGIG